MNWLKRKLKEERWFPYTFAACCAVLLAFLLINIATVQAVLAALLKVISPVLLGVVFAYIMDPVARFFENRVFKKAKNRRIVRNISVYLSIFVTIVALALLIFAFIPPIVNSATTLFNSREASLASLSASFERTVNKLSMDLFHRPASFTTFDNIIDWIMNQFSGDSGSGFSGILEKGMGVGSGFVSGLIGFILAIYFLLYKERMLKVTKRFLLFLLKEKRYVAFTGFCYKCDRIFIKFLEFDIIEAIFVGSANAIFMALFGMDNITLISVIVGVTNLAPTFGPIVGAIFGAILLLFSNPWNALWFLIFTIIIQTIDGYVLKPKLFGDTLGVSPVIILIAITLGGRLFGVLGILLAIPFSAIVQVLFKDYILKRKIKSN